MNKLLLVLIMVAGVFSSFAADTPLCTWNYKTGSTNVWWFADVNFWKCQTFNGSTYSPREPVEFPRSTDVVWAGVNALQSPWIYLKEGDNVTILGLDVGFGNSSGDRSLVEVRTGAYLRVNGNINATWQGIQFSNSDHAHGCLWINGGVVESTSGTKLDGNATASTAKLRITNGGILTNAYFNVSGSCPAAIEVDDGTFFIGKDANIGLGGGASSVTLTVSNGSFFRPSRCSDFKANSHTAISDSYVEQSVADWSLSRAPVVITSTAGKTTGIYLTNSTWVVYDPAWDTAPSAAKPKGSHGYRWGEWYRIEFKNSGYAEFVQKDSVVTNNGVWFRTSNNADGLAPRYVVDGGELYVYNLYTESSPAAYPSGQAYMGFAAANEAPNSGTIEFLNQAKVSFPSINTNIVVSGNVQTLAYAITTNRPHLKFTLTKGGHRPAEIRVQTNVMGMWSFEPQGGLQVVQTNRFALLRHKTTSKTLTTCDEPQFRAPNADLWTTGGFADTPCEWGVTLKPEAEIASDEDLGDGVASGFVKLPRCNPEKLLKGQLRLKLAPGAKTVAEAVADLNAAGYPTTLEGTDEAVVDLMASGMLAKGAANTVLLDFNAPQDAVGVRDNVKTANVRILGATTDIVGQGLTIILK